MPRDGSPCAGWAPQAARHLPWPLSNPISGSWVGKAGGLPYSSRPSPSPTASLVLLGGGNGFCWDKAEPSEQDRILQESSWGWHRAGGALPGISKMLSLHWDWTQLLSPAPECHVGVLQHSVPHQAGHKEGPRV